MRYWVFRDFVSARGDNLIHRWLHNLPVAARAAINNRIFFLEATRDLRRPDVGILTGQCKGLIEIRVTVNRVQYRPLGFYGPQKGEVTLLIGAIEKGGAFEPRSACTTALDRIKLLNGGRETTVDHDFN